MTTWATRQRPYWVWVILLKHPPPSSLEDPLFPEMPVSESEQLQILEVSFYWPGHGLSYLSSFPLYITCEGPSGGLPHHSGQGQVPDRPIF